MHAAKFAKATFAGSLDSAASGQDGARHGFDEQHRAGDRNRLRPLMRGTPAGASGSPEAVAYAAVAR